MRLHLHQSHLEFLICFFGGKNLSSDHPQDIPETDISAEALLPFFQKFSISPVVIWVDYIPSHVDLVALGHGKFVELVNIFQWKGVELKLKHVASIGVYGWSSVCETIIGEWLKDISQNQAAPGAAIAPASAAARAVYSALPGARNSLDPEHKKDSVDKYLGTTQAERR